MHNPGWEKLSRWRAEFENCAKAVLHGGIDGANQEYWIVFSRHMKHLEEETYLDKSGMPKNRWIVVEPGLSVRDTVGLIQDMYGPGAIGMNLFYATMRLVAEKVGGELDRRGVWPIADYLGYRPPDAA